MNELHLFTGAGGGVLGGMLLGHTAVCAVEIEPYCRKVLLQRQRDGILPQCEGRSISGGIHQKHSDLGRPDWWQSEPGMERVADGMANRMDRLKAIGNGQVPSVAALAWNTLIQ